MLTTIMKKLFILYTLLFLLPLLQHNSGALHAQGSSGCYVSYKENLGLTEVVGLPELQAEACSLANALPTTFQSQFKVYSVAYYLYTPLMGDGTPPALAQYVAEIAALSPYYLIIAKENTPNALVNKFSIVLKLPDTEGFSCLTENDRSFFQRQLEIEAKSEYSQRGNLPSNYPFAEKKVVEQLKKYITKSLDCCAGGNKLPCESCSPCPDIPAATAIEDYFTNVLFKGDLPNIVKLPIVIDDCFDPTDPANSQTLSRVQTVKELPFKFREEDPGFGRIGTVVNSVLTSDYFEGVDPEKIKGFVTSNYVECSIADKEAFENIKNIFTPPPGGFAKSSTSYDYLVWCHIWQNPSSPTEGYLYIYGEIPGGRSPLETGGGFGEKVVKALEKSYLYEYEETAYNSRFEQNGTVVVFKTVSACFDPILAGSQEDHIPDYNPPAEIINCSTSLAYQTWFLSPAMQPVLIPQRAIPDFSRDEVASFFGFDRRALVFFTTTTERWHGCFHPIEVDGIKSYESFTGYYSVPTQGVKRYVSVPPGHITQPFYQVLINEYNISDPTVRTLIFKEYHPTRPHTSYAEGSLYYDFDATGSGLQNSTITINPAPYSLIPDLNAALLKLEDALDSARYSPIHKGIILRVKTTGNSNLYTFYMVHAKDPADIDSDTRWSIFNCATGRWELLDNNPFAANDPDWGNFLLELRQSFSTIHLTLGIAGMIPVLGEAFDVIDGMVCIIEGDGTGAAISFGAAFLPFFSPIVVNGVKSIRLPLGSVGDLRSITGRLHDVYKSALVSKINEVAEALSKKDVKNILYYTTCLIGNKGPDSDPNTVQCLIDVPIDDMLKKASSLGLVDPISWGEFISELNTKALDEDLAKRDLDFIEAAANSVKGGAFSGPDLFHAWNAAKKAGTTMDLDLLKKLAGDIEHNPALIAAFKNDEELVHTWKTLDVNNVNASWRSSPEVLTSAKKHLADADFLARVGNGNMDSGFENYIQVIKSYTGKCSGCGNLGYAQLPRIDEYLNKIYDFSKFSDIPGFNIPNFPNQPYSQEGFYHMMRHCNNYNPAQVKKIDMTFEDELGNSLPCQGQNVSSCFDLELDFDLSGVRFVEYKSMKKGSMHNLNYNQFKAYLLNSNSLDEFKYIFNKNKINDDELKSAMINFLQNKASAIFNDIGQTKFEQLFGVPDSNSLINLLNGTNQTAINNILRFLSTN